LLGGTGFIGRHLISHLTRKGHQLIILSRAPRPDLEQDKVTVLVGDPLQAGTWQERAAECQAIINLVGRNIMARWTRTVKNEILESRVQPTNLVVQAIKMSPGDKPVLINANAVGYYPFTDTRVFDETGPPGDHFLARVCVAWQEAAQQASSLGSRVVVARFSSSFCLCSKRVWAAGLGAEIKHFPGSTFRMWSRPWTWLSPIILWKDH
jgi:hypothetical protein